MKGGFEPPAPELKVRSCSPLCSKVEAKKVGNSIAPQSLGVKYRESQHYLSIGFQLFGVYCKALGEDHDNKEMGAYPDSFGKLASFATPKFTAGI